VQLLITKIDAQYIRGSVEQGNNNKTGISREQRVS